MEDEKTQESQVTEEQVTVENQEQTVENQTQEGQENLESQEQVDLDLVDPSDGKSWKEKAREYERKYHSVNERFINFQRQPEPDVDENEEIPATRAGIKQVLTEQQQAESRADSIFNITMEEVLTEKPEFAPFTEELRAMIKTLPNVNDRKNPDTIKIIAQGLWGQKHWKQKEQLSQSAKRIVAQKSADVLAPSSKSGSASTVILNEEERAYRDLHRLVQKAYSDAEIKEQYQMYQKKKN